MPGEFQIIAEHFQRHAHAEGLVLGIGDDGAVLRPRAGFDQVVVTDTLVEGRHFPEDFAAQDIGWRALAVNLSDIAAMGATPRFAFLNLTLDQPDERWLRDFSAGFFALADATNTVLAGGDTTEGPLTISVTVIGEVPAAAALRRSGARPGDLVCVSGAPGEASAGLELWQAGNREHPLARRFRRPEPRLALGERLRGRASAAIDISDGLLADLGHIATASNVGARIEFAALPLSSALAGYAVNPHDHALAGGDDYELCFCLAPDAFAELRAHDTGCAISVIGEIVGGEGVLVIDEQGNPYEPARRGWEHFGARS